LQHEAPLPSHAAYQLPAHHFTTPTRNFTIALTLHRASLGRHVLALISIAPMTRLESPTLLVTPHEKAILHRVIARKEWLAVQLK
jgi:hypothetical protein